MDVLQIVLQILPTLLTSSILFYLQRRQKRRDQEMREKVDARREEAMLTMELQIANAELAYATAIACKTGKTNGEMTAAMQTYAEAKEKWLAFLRKQATEHLMEG